MSEPVCNLITESGYGHGKGTTCGKPIVETLHNIAMCIDHANETRRANGMPLLVTAETITDEQIRELRIRTGWLGKVCEESQADFAIALCRPRDASMQAAKNEARTRCAEILNAREASK